MGIFDALSEWWNGLQFWLQFIVPGLVIYIIIVILSSIKNGWADFMERLRNIMSSKWWVVWFIIALVAFYIFWADFKESIGW